MTTLDELAIALAAEAPRPSADFARRMDARVAAGFPRKRFVPKLPPVALLGSAAAIVVAVIVAVSLIGNSGTANKSFKAPPKVMRCAPRRCGDCEDVGRFCTTDGRRQLLTPSGSMMVKPKSCGTGFWYCPKLSKERYWSF